MAINVDEYKKNYWNYFLELENQLLETKRYIEFEKNCNAYSIEYLKLYQAVCSEIDVIGKELACVVDPSFKVKEDTNIKKWGFAVQQEFNDLKDVIILFNDNISVQPFKNWEYIKTSKKIKIANKNSIKWWKNYNDVKHRRIGLIDGENNYKLANQRNLISSFCGLFILESKMMQKLDCNDYLGESKLFSLQLENEEQNN